MGALLRFVDGIGGATLLDLTGNGWVRLGDGFDAPPPPIDRVVVSNPLRDGGQVPTSAYGLREITLPVVVPHDIAGALAGSSTARRDALQTLFRILNRERFWLEVHDRNTSTSRYLYCYRSPDAEELLARLTNSTAQVTITVLADPFAYGAKENLGTVTTTVAGDLRATVPGTSIKGDVSCPAMLSWTPLVATLGQQLYVGSRTGPMPHDPVIPIDTAWTSASSSTLNSDTMAFDGNYRQFTFASNGDSIRMTGTAVLPRAGQSATALDGVYRAFLVCNDGGSYGINDQWEVTLALGFQPYYFGGGYPTITTVSYVRSTNAGNLLDLGLVQLPYGNRQTSLGLDAESNVESLDLSVQVTRKHAAGAGTSTDFGLDALILVPADEALLIEQVFTKTSGATRTFVTDPFTGQFVTVNTAGQVVADQVRASYVGSPPILTPGQDCNLVAFQTTGVQPQVYAYGQNASGAEAGCSFSLVYWPQYLTVF